MKQYKQDPITEAICEFHFEPSSTWDLTVPGLIYEKLQSAFPEKRQCKLVNQVIAPADAGSVPQIEIVDRIQFYNAAKTALVQTNQHFLSINHLRPYPTWTKFLPIIKEGLDAYCCAAQPLSITKVGLRYLNRIEIPGPKAALPEYFNIYPGMADTVLPHDFSSCIVGVRSQVPELGGEIKIQLTSAGGANDLVAMMLDLEYAIGVPGGMQVEQALTWLAQAHKKLVETFECSVTEKTRGSFGKPNRQH